VITIKEQEGTERITEEEEKTKKKVPEA